MNVSDYWSMVVNTIKPVRSIFGFYVLIFLFPLSIPLAVVANTYSRLFNDATNQVNVGAAVIIGICGALVFGWAIFFLLYFTMQRTRNPHLYRKGFLTDFSVKGK